MEIRQVALYPSGYQRWNSRLIIATSEFLIYTSSLAIYVINLANYHLDILTGHENTITSIIACDDSNTIIASSSLDQTIRIWDIKRLLEVNRISTAGSSGFVPHSLAWDKSDSTTIIAGGKGTIKAYNVYSRKGVSHKLGIDQEVLITSYNPKQPHILICISADGTVLLYNLKKKTVTSRYRSPTAKVTDISWDPLSEYYFLCSYDDGSVQLFDCSLTQSFLLKTYNPDCRNLSTISWLPTEPGNFITGDRHSGILRVWNVSKSEPSQRFKVRKSGIKFLTVLNSKEDQINDDCLAIAFEDGSVGIYNRKQHEMEYITLPGHSETIFDCAFATHDPNLFASSSFDSTVKIWNIRTQTCVENLIGADNTVIYSVSWHPTAGKIAGSLGNGEIWIWDARNGRVLHQHKLHSNFAYKVAWNQHDTSLIASASKDKTCCVFREDGKLLKQYKHPNTAFGIDWSPHDKYLLATGCHDGLVRVFDVSKPESSPILKLSGHTHAVYNVVWHPIIPNVLMSGSNDHTVRVWNTSNGTSKVLEGHTNNIRALAWNPELPNIALSGSWDGSIRVWDVQNATCLSSVYHHHVDVYGLSVHPDRPFIYGSTSRDSTIRFWTLEPLIKDIVLKAVMSKNFATVLKKPESPFSTTTIERGLAGRVSSELQDSLKLSKSDIDTYAKIFNFFSFPQGTNDLWSLASVAIEDDTMKQQSEFLHTKIIVNTLDSTARELENIRSQKYTGGLGSSTKEEQLKEAARIYLSLGNTYKYCEIMSEIGEWSIALAVAPSVSRNYWKQIVSRYIQYTQEHDQSADIVPYLTAIGDGDDLISYYTKRKNFKQATITALRQAEEVLSYKSEVGDEMEHRAPKQLNGPSQQMLRVCSQRAEHFLKMAQPVSAACTFLSINEYQQAVRALMKGDEVVMAYALAGVCGVTEMDDIHVAIANLCEKFSMWDLGIEMLQQIQDRNAIARFMCTISEKTSLSETEMEKLFLRSGLQAPSFYVTEAKSVENTNPLEAIRFYALAKQHQQAATLANQQFDRLFGEDSWNWKEIEMCMNFAQCINATQLSVETRIRFMAFVNYVGLQRALWKRYYAIAPCLIMNVRTACKQLKSFPIPWEYLDFKLCLAFSKTSRVECNTLITQVLQTNLSSEIREELERLKFQIQSSAAANSFKNVVIPTGSSLPTRSADGTRVRSYISKSFIGAPYISLEDEKSHISLAEAIMWAEVNRFSPTMSGAKIHF